MFVPQTEIIHEKIPRGGPAQPAEGEPAVRVRDHRPGQASGTRFNALRNMSSSLIPSTRRFTVSTRSSTPSAGDPASQAPDRESRAPVATRRRQKADRVATRAQTSQRRTRMPMPQHRKAGIGRVIARRSMRYLPDSSQWPSHSSNAEWVWKPVIKEGSTWSGVDRHGSIRYRLALGIRTRPVTNIRPGDDESGCGCPVTDCD